MKNKYLKTKYNENGYLLIKDFFNEQEIEPIHDV